MIGYVETLKGFRTAWVSLWRNPFRVAISQKDIRGPRAAKAQRYHPVTGCPHGDPGPGLKFANTFGVKLRRGTLTVLIARATRYNPITELQGTYPVDAHHHKCTAPVR